MSIASVEDLKNAYDSERVEGFASDYSSDAGLPVYLKSIVESILADAEGSVLLALSTQYELEQLEADKGIKRIVLDIAMYLLESRKGDPGQIVITAFQRAQQMLRDLQDGKAKLADVEQYLPSIRTNNGSQALRITSQGMFDGVFDDEEFDL